MQEITDYGKVFEALIEKTEEYVLGNNLHAMVLGISGGIDSTVVAAICHEVFKRTNIPLIGRSLPTHFNKNEEVTTADLVGKAFCNDYLELSISNLFNTCLLWINGKEKVDQTPIANGNIQARLRMMYLYNLASIYGGLVMDTDNLTENNLGYFTIHGDVGDFNPIGGLWKTEVFELAEWLYKYYYYTPEVENCKDLENASQEIKDKFDKARALLASSLLKPTAGLGITNNDLEEIGAESYEQVDSILKEILAWKWALKAINRLPKDIQEQKKQFLEDQELLCYPYEVVEAVTNRHFISEFKRKQLPIKITRDAILV